MEKSATLTPDASPNIVKDYSLLEMEVGCFMFDYEKGKKFAYYLITGKYTRHIKWEVRRRYRQFSSLAESLKKSFINIPALPGKTIFTLKEDAALEKRRLGLNSFLQSLISRQELFSSPDFWSFLGLAKHVPFLIANMPIPLGLIQNQNSMGYRDAYISLDQDFGVVASHSIFVANRVDSYFSNLFSKKSQGNQKSLVTKSSEKSVGLIEFVKRVNKGAEIPIIPLPDGSTGSKHATQLEELKPLTPILLGPKDKGAKEEDPLGYFNFQKMFDKAFKYQVISLGWCPELLTFAVGLDSGDIFILGYDPGNNKGFVKETSLIKAHSKRVMRFAFDSKRGWVFSVGEDKKLCIISIQEEQTISKMMLPGAGLTHMIYHQSKSILFISEKGPNVYVVNASKKFPELAQKINTHTKGPIRGMQEVFSHNVLLVCSHGDGLIKGFYNERMEDPNGQYLCILQLQTSPNPRCVFYWPQRKEVWIGHSKGNVSVFNNITFDSPPAASTEAQTKPCCR
jgi:WD40 repeat protein